MQKNELNTLLELKENPSLTQRSLAHRLNISLGLTNAILQNLIHRGWIKAKKLTGRKILYLITPQGMARATNLIYDRFRETQQYYQQAKNLISACLDRLYQQGIREVVIYGTNQLSEITYLSLLDSPVKLHSILTDKPTPDQKKFLGQEVLTLSDFFQKISQGIRGTSDSEKLEKLYNQLIILSAINYQDKDKKNNQASNLEIEIKKYKDIFPELKIKIITLEDILKDTRV